MPRALKELDREGSVVVFATHALYQISRESRRTLLQRLQAGSAELGRRIDFILMESTGSEHSELTITTYQRGGRHTRKLANANPHGRWLEWLSPES